MGLVRRLKRNIAKKQYKKFAGDWRMIKTQQKEEIAEGKEGRATAIPMLGRRPTFSHWMRIVAGNMEQAKQATPEEVDEFRKETEDLDWEDPK